MALEPVARPEVRAPRRWAVPGPARLDLPGRAVRPNRLVRVSAGWSAGLALFAVTGSLKALAFHLPPVGAVVLGVMTGVGGGVIRDLLVREVPTVFLNVELYAVAALAGAVVVVAGRMLDLPTPIVALAGVGVGFTLRMLAIQRRWRLPVAPS